MDRHADGRGGMRVGLRQCVAKPERPVRRDVRVVGAAFEGDGGRVGVVAEVGQRVKVVVEPLRVRIGFALRQEPRRVADVPHAGPVQSGVAAIAATRLMR